MPFQTAVSTKHCKYSKKEHYNWIPTSKMWIKGKGKAIAL